MSTDAALVIEVSVSSLQRDLARKPSLYAAAGVEETGSSTSTVAVR